MNMRKMMRLKQQWQLYALVMPVVVYLLIFQYYPMYGAQIAFKKYRVLEGIAGSPWIGFAHFERFFNSYDFWNIMWNTIGLSVYDIVASFPFPILLALSINYLRHASVRKFVQMVTYAPFFISSVVMIGILMQFLDPRIGMINGFLQLFGAEPINFIAHAGMFKSIYVWSGIWQNTGFGCIIYLAALAGIDPSLHEAAIVDGATKIRRMWHIDLPGIMPVAIILLIMSAGQILNTGFEKIYLMQNPLNIRTSEVIDTYVYQIGLISAAMDYSYATAIGLFKSVVSLAMLVAVNKVAQKTNQTSLW